MQSSNTRRDFLRSSAVVGAGLVLSSCGGRNNPQAENQEGKEASAKTDGHANGEVTATEDLMREHGVLRRALLVYSAVATKLRSDSSLVPAAAVQKTAALFRAFGEEYHEKKLEEGYIFPAVKQAGGP